MIVRDLYYKAVPTTPLLAGKVTYHYARVWGTEGTQRFLSARQKEYDEQADKGRGLRVVVSQITKQQYKDRS